MAENGLKNDEGEEEEKKEKIVRKSGKDNSGKVDAKNTNEEME